MTACNCDEGQAILFMLNGDLLRDIRGETKSAWPILLEDKGDHVVRVVMPSSLPVMSSSLLTGDTVLCLASATAADNGDLVRSELFNGGESDLPSRGDTLGEHQTAMESLASTTDRGAVRNLSAAKQD